MAEAILPVFRGTQEGGATYQDYPVPVYEGASITRALKSRGAAE